MNWQGKETLLGYLMCIKRLNNIRTNILCMISTSSSLETEAGFVLRSLMLPVGYDNTTNTDSVSVYNEIEEFY